MRSGRSDCSSPQPSQDTCTQQSLNSDPTVWTYLCSASASILSVTSSQRGRGALDRTVTSSCAGVLVLPFLNLSLVQSSFADTPPRQYFALPFSFISFSVFANCVLGESPTLHKQVPERKATHYSPPVPDIYTRRKDS